MTGIALTLEAGEPHPPAGRTDDDHVVDARGPGNLDAQLAEQANAPGTDEVTARLVPGKRGLVDHGDARAATGEDQCGDAAARTCSHHEGVVSSTVHRAPSWSGRNLRLSVARQEGARRVVRPSDPNRFARALFGGLPRRYDLLAELLSFGQNGRWRREAVEQVAAAAPARTLDVATGTAGVALRLVERTESHVTGIDLTESMLRRGAANVASAGRGGRVDLAAGRAEQLPFADATFDALTFSYLLRYVADPAATLRELARVVKPGGQIASLEFHVPGNPLWRALWWLYTRLALPVGGLLTGGREWYTVGRFLGPNISDHYRRYPLDWTVAAWRSAGIVDVGTEVMSLGGGLVMWGKKSGG